MAQMYLLFVLLTVSLVSLDDNNLVHLELVKWHWARD